MAEDKKFIVKDSGARQEFSTGSRRDLADGKGRFDLIPTLPMRRLALHYEAGAKKYGDNNWRKGQPLSRYLDSLERHLNCLKAGEPTEDHAIAIAWNAFSYVHTLDAIERGELPKELDNRPPVEAQYRRRHEEIVRETVAEEIGETPVEKKFLGEEMVVETVAGMPLHVTAWQKGGCVVCGGTDRAGCGLAHPTCYDKIGGKATGYHERLFSLGRDGK